MALSREELDEAEGLTVREVTISQTEPGRPPKSPSGQ